MATNLTPEAVWEAIDAAKDGDTVELPAGTADWSKGWNTGRGAKMKAITIRGAGMDETVIRDHRSRRGSSVPFELQGVEGKPFRITGITFDGTGWPDAGLWGGYISIIGTCKNLRIDHCKFKSASVMMTINGDTYGLIDHCSFDDKEFAGGLAQPIWFSGPGAPNYRKPLSLGTVEALYLEDNEVHLNAVAAKGGDCPWIAPNNGARVVIRHNKIVNSQIEIYGVGVREGYYGCQSAEIYENTFSAIGLKQGEPQGFIFINAGVGIIFNNTVTVTTYNTRTIQLTHERSFVDRGGFGVCDGATLSTAIRPLRVRRGRAILAWDSRAAERMPTATVCSSRPPATPGTTRSTGRNSAWHCAPGPIRSMRRNKQSRSKKSGISSTKSPKPNTTSRTPIHIRFKAAGTR
jgi:hypothetical protein